MVSQHPVILPIPTPETPMKKGFWKVLIIIIDLESKE
jgi:hypothetical protein